MKIRVLRTFQFSAKKDLSAGGLEEFESFLRLVGADVKAGKLTHIIIELCISTNAGLCH